MTTESTAAAGAHAPRLRIGVPRVPGVALQLGLVVTYLSLVVLIPLAAVVVKATDLGWDAFWSAVTSPEAIASLKLTLVVSLLVAAINALAGTLIAWVLVRDSFRGKAFVNSLIDLPFALPTIVAGLILLALYGPKTPVGIDVAYTRTAIGLALLFITLPFVVRAVQPVLMELDKEMEEAAASLGASSLTTFRRIILPNLLPAILAGVGLAFARAVGEFGSLVLITGNLPFKTEVASVFIYGQIESDRAGTAAAVSVVLLAIALVVLLGISRCRRWGAGMTISSRSSSRCARTRPGSACASSRSATCSRCSQRRSAWSSTGPSSTASARLGGGHHAGGAARVLAHDLMVLVAVPLNTIFGVTCALLIVRHRFPGRWLLNALIDLPFAISPVVIGLALILVYGQTGWFGDWLAAAGDPGDLLAAGHDPRDDVRLAAVRRARGDPGAARGRHGAGAGGRRRSARRGGRPSGGSRCPRSGGA